MNRKLELIVKADAYLQAFIACAVVYWEVNNFLTEIYLNFCISWCSFITNYMQRLSINDHSHASCNNMQRCSSKWLKYKENNFKVKINYIFATKILYNKAEL